MFQKNSGKKPREEEISRKSQSQIILKEIFLSKSIELPRDATKIQLSYKTPNYYKHLIAKKENFFFETYEYTTSVQQVTHNFLKIYSLKCGNGCLMLLLKNLQKIKGKWIRKY